MAIRLIKTIGGSSGTPDKCPGCGSTHFMRAGIAWHCANCGVYFPANLSTQGSLSRLKANFNDLTKLQGELKTMVSELEELVKE